MYTTSDWASPNCPSPLSTAETATTPPGVGRRSMWAWESSRLKRRIRSLVNPGAMPDHRVSCCGRGAAAPDVQAVAHSAASNAVARPGRRRGRKRDDIGVTEPLPKAKPDYTGTVWACPLVDDN